MIGWGIGWPTTAEVGRGTSRVSTCGLTMLLGYIRWRRTTRESGSTTGANRTLRPAMVTSLMPARRARARNSATNSRLCTSIGGSP